MNYNEFIQNILNTRGRFGCGESYHERHHITPKCLGGTNEDENLIDLYAREHYEAHKLLAEENPHECSLQYAWWMMSHSFNKHREKYIVTEEEYTRAKESFSNIMTNRVVSDDTRKKLSLVSKGKKVSEKTKKKMSDAQKGISKWSLEDKERLSIAQKKRFSSKEEIDKISKAHIGKTHSEATRKKISDCQKERLKAEDFVEELAKINRKKIVQYDKDGNFLKIWDSITQAQKELKITHISECCSNKRKFAGGFIWKYEKKDGESDDKF